MNKAAYLAPGSHPGEMRVLLVIDGREFVLETKSIMISHLVGCHEIRIEGGLQGELEHAVLELLNGKPEGRPRPSVVELPAASFRAPRRGELRSRYEEMCPRCGHVHQGDRECGEDIGGGRRCRCEMEVPA